MLRGEPILKERWPASRAVTKIIGILVMMKTVNNATFSIEVA